MSFQAISFGRKLLAPHENYFKRVVTVAKKIVPSFDSDGCARLGTSKRLKHFPIFFSMIHGLCIFLKARVIIEKSTGCRVGAAL